MQKIREITNTITYSGSVKALNMSPSSSPHLKSALNSDISLTLYPHVYLDIELRAEYYCLFRIYDHLLTTICCLMLQSENLCSKTYTDTRCLQLDPR
jgi:hypothetical protein